MCFMALSNAFGAVTWYLNEDFESGQIPASWTQEVVSSNVASWVIEPTSAATYPATGNESNYYVALRNNTGMDQHYVTKLITPAIDFTVGEVSNPQLVFNHAQVGVGQDFDTLKVYCRANATAPWTLLRVFNSRMDVWTMDTVALTGFTSASAYQIGFEAVENMGRGIVLDDVRIMNASQCVMPSGVEMIVPGTTSVKLTWNGDLMADTFEVVVSKVAIVDWNSYIAAFHGYATDFEIEATGLEHSTTYFAYVRSNCNDNETGWTEWAMGTFRTRARMELPYVKGFAEGLPEGWTRATYWSASQPSFPTTSLPSYSVDSTAAMVFSAVLAKGRACAITPEVNVPSLQGVEVSFWGTAGTNIQTPLNSNIARLYVGVMDDPEDSSSLVIVDSVEVKVANKHQRFDVSMANYTGNGLYLAFMVGNPTRTSYFYLDSLIISQPNAFVPAVSLSNATPDGFDVNVDLKGASSWNLRIARAADYKHKGGLPSSFILSQNGLSGNTYHVSGNYGDSIVAVYVQGVNAAGTSAWSFPVTLRVPGRATLPLAYEFNSESDASVFVKSLDNEFTINSTAKTYPFLYFPLKDLTNFYPMYSSATPKYNNSTHVILQGLDQWMALPYIESFENKTLSFQLAAGNQGESRVAVGIMVDPYDLSTFTQLATFDGPSGTFMKCEVDLGGLNVAGHYLAFIAVKPASYNATLGSINHIDAIHIDNTPSCREASSVNVSDNGTSLSLTWEARGMNNWIVELFSGTSANQLLRSLNVQVPAATFDSLDVLTGYYYRINTVCGNDTVIGENKLYYKTGCEDIASLPWTEGFESYSTGNYSSPAIDCWTLLNANDGTSLTYPQVYVNNSSTYVKTGSKSLYFISSNSRYAYVVLPKFAAPLNTLQIKFSHKEESLTSSGYLELGYMTNKNNAASFVPVATFERLKAWQTEEVMLYNIPADVAADAYLAFRYGGASSNYYMGIDDITVDVIPSCPRPSTIEVDTVTATSATLSWPVGLNEHQWQYVYSAVGGAPDWDNAPIINTPTVQLTGLGGCSTYTFYVRAYCSADDQSEVTSKEFQTGDGVIAMPYMETFNNLSVSGSIPACWDNSEGTTTNSTYKWCFYDGTGGYNSNGSCLGTGPDGSNCVRFNSYSNSNNNTNLLRTPKILLSQAAKLTFQIKNPDGGAVRVLLSTITDSTKVVLMNSGLTDLSEWTEKSIDLAAYIGQTVMIYFEGTSNYGYSDAYMYLDNVKIATYDVNCAGLYDLRAAGSSPTEASILWAVGGNQAIDVEVSDSANFVNPTTYLGVTQNPFILDQLASNHTYYVRARQSCDAAGAWVEASFKTLCAAVTPEEAGIQNFEHSGDLDCWVVGVATPGVRTSSAPYISSTTGRGHYLYFTKTATSDSITYDDGLYAIMPKLDVDSINKFEVSFSACKTSSAATNLGNLAVGIVTDPSDFSTFTSIKSLRLEYAADSLEMKNYTISFRDYMGDYNDDYGKYIIFLAQAGDSANAIAIDNVEISPAHSCPQIVEGAISNIQENGATYRWDANGASLYQVAVLAAIGNPDVDEVIFTDSTTTDSLVITGLGAATTYYAYVRAKCGDEYSRWSTHTSFQTACGIVLLPYAEGFNNLSTSGALTPCWDNSLGTITSATYKWCYNSGTSNGGCDGKGPDGSNCIRMNSYMASEGQYNYLRTPDIYLSKPAILEFQWMNPAGGAGEVFIARAGDSIMTPLIGSAALTGISAWTEMSATLFEFTGDTVNIYFKGTSNYGNGDAYLYLDNVKVYAAPSCMAPAAIVTSDLGRRNVTVTLLPKPGASLSNCELVWSQTALNAAALDSAETVIVDSTGVYTITGLTRNTHYYIYARQNCGEEDGVSEWVSAEITTKNLGPDCRGVEPGTLINSTSTIQYVPWSDYYNSTRSQQIYLKEELLAQGLQAGYISKIAFQYAHTVAYTKTVTLFLGLTNKAAFTSTAFEDLAEVSEPVSTVFDTDGAWYEFELSTPFYWDGESNLVVGMLAMGTNYPSSGTPTFYGTTGTANMALYSRSDTSIPSATTGTQSKNRANIRLSICPPGSPCPNVRNMTYELLGAGTSEALIRWEASDGDYLSGYDVVFSDSIITDFTGITPSVSGVQVDSIVMGELSPETTYYVYVRANCMAEGHDDGSSDWVGISFTTLANCPAVTNLASDLYNAANTIRVIWTPAFAEQDLHFAYVYSTDSLSAAEIASAEKHYVNDTLLVDLTDLAYNQTYYIYVASVCGSNFSPWSKTVAKTDAACATARNLTIARVEHNRVVLTWERSRFGAETQWEVGVLGDTASVVFVSDTAQTVSAMIIGLIQQTQYTAFVRTICGDGEVSEMVTLPFTTPAVADGCATVGTGTSSGNMPVTNYNYAYTQMLYPADLFTGAGNIISIKFQRSSYANVMNNMKVYLGHTNKTTFSGTTDWVPASDLVEVYSGDFPVGTEWLELDLDNPFAYDGTSTLVVAISNAHADWQNIQNFYYTTATNTVHTRRDDNYPTYADHPGTAAGQTPSSERTNMQFCFSSDGECAPVTALQVGNITTTTAFATWEPMGSDRSWRVYLADTVITDFTGLVVDTAYTYSYALANLQPDKDYWFYVQPLCGADWKAVKFVTAATCSQPINLHAENVTDVKAVLVWEDELGVGSAYEVVYGLAENFNLNDPTTYKTILVTDTNAVQIDSLVAVTNYSFAVKTICSASLSSRYSDVVTFQTECAMGSWPFYESFDRLSAGIPACWDNSEGTTVTASYKWTYYEGGFDGACVSFDSYYNTSGNTNILVTPAILLVEDAFLTFQWKNPTGGDAEVLISTDGGATRTTLMTTGLTGVTNWTEESINLSAYTGQVVHIYFKGTSNYGYGDAYLYLDDVRVGAAPTCFKPESVEVTAVTASEASFAWVPGETVAQWQYVCVPYNAELDWTNAVVTDSLTATVTGLEAATSYTFYVRAYCSSEDQSVEISTTFSTACDVITALPWSEGFEAYQGGSYSSTSTDLFPACWQVSTGGYVAPHVTTASSYAFVHSGSKSLTFYGDSASVAILPKFDTSLDALQMSFYYRNYSSSSSYSGVLVLCYVSWSDSTLHMIEAYQPTTEFTKIKVMLDTLPSTADQLAFWYSGGLSSYSSSYTASVDDILIDSINYNCMGTRNFHMGQFSMAGATFEWEYAGGANNAQIQVATDQDFTEIFDSTLVQNAASYVVTGLQQATTYYVRVRQACGDGEFSDWSTTLSFSTPSHVLPYIPTMSATEPDDWFFSNTKASDAFNGEELNPYTSSGYSGWSKVAADTVIDAYHFRGNIYGSSWNYWAVTPAIDMTDNVGQGVILSFDAGLTAYSSTSQDKIYTGTDDRFLVAVSIDGGASWQAANVAAEWNNSGTGDFVYNDVPLVGTTYHINMSDYTGHVVKIGFYGESTATNADNYFHFGNVRLETVETTNFSDTLCEGYSFNKNGFNISYDQLHVGLNTFSRYEVNLDNTMSLTIQQVLVNAASIVEIPVTLCEGEHFNDYGFDVTATVSQNVRKRLDGGNQFGCDSTVILQMTVIPTVRTEIHVGCNEDSYTWHGKTYYQSTIVDDTTSSAVTGCDSITTLYLTMCEPTTYNYFNAFCEGGSYSDEFFTNLTTAGDYSTTVIDELGCETHANVTLRSLKSGQDYVDSVHVSNLPYVIGNDTVCPETDQPGFVYHGSKDFGCGMVNVTIYVYDIVGLNNIAAGTLQVAPNPVRIGEDIKILTAVDLTSDYSCRVFDAVGKLVYETDKPSTIIPGLPVAGAYTIRITAGTAIYQGKLIVK